MTTISTVDLFISPTDGWVKVATSPASALIKPSSFHPWWVVAVASGTPNAAATRASGTVTFSGLPTAAETVTVNGQVYTFRASVGTTANEVKIGASAGATGDNLAAAINRGVGSGTTYGSATVANTGVTASSNGSGVVTLTARAPGTAGNAVALTEAATNTVASGATLTGAVSETIGVAMGRDSNQRYEPFTSGAIAGDLYIRIKEPLDETGQKMHFGIIADQ